LRYESDLTILAFVTAFFALAITVMQLASRFHWRLRGASPAVAVSPLSRIVTVLKQPQLLPRFSYLAIVIALGLYAALIVLGTAALSGDLRILVLSLFVLAIALLVLLRVGSLGLIDKAALYVTTTMLVYLDGVVMPADRLMSVLTWIAVSVAAVATAVRLRLQNDWRFQVTPLDLIVLFMALIVPSLGPFNLPHGGALVIAKLLILFYAIEVMVSRTDGRAVWMRVAVVSILAGLAVRPLIPF
jgi:UDP-GlcNAc:undecaprenyl-phosphate/decaprenyl-phosphate GlcNAc-1-phosphate transferase